MADLLDSAAALVDIPSVSHHEQAMADELERQLVGHGHLVVERIGDNVVARTELGRLERLVLAGHTDTVPPQGNEGARVEGDRLYGLGAADMKGTLAVLLDLARSVVEPEVDVTYVFYAREEVASRHSGLLELFETRPDLLGADAALLGEPTGGALEAGCQGTLRLRVALAGDRAHTARPWRGTNAIHRLGEVLRLLEADEDRRPVLEGCEFREATQAVFVEGGAAGNVVPDHAVVVVNHRFAPDRTADEAVAHLRQRLEPALESRDRLEVVEQAAPAYPSTTQPLIAALVEREGLAVRAKLGWTDVARFAERGIPAANFGAGDPERAHTADEWVERNELEALGGALGRLLALGAG